jgi:hypothetical protein
MWRRREAARRVEPQSHADGSLAATDKSPAPLPSRTQGAVEDVAVVEPVYPLCVMKPAAVTNVADELIGNLLDPVSGPACGLPYQVRGKVAAAGGAATYRS